MSVVDGLIVWDDSEPVVEWVEGVRGAGLVGGAVPAVFDAYARVLHPAAFEDRTGWRFLRWGDVAAANRQALAADSEWESVSDPIAGPVSADGPAWNTEPEEGSLYQETAEALIGALARHTSTPDVVWLCAWIGWAGLRWATPGSEVAVLTTAHTRRYRLRDVLRHVSHRRDRSSQRDRLPTVSLVGREYLLLRGSTVVAGQSVVEGPSRQSASLWWPDDRSWFLSDRKSTRLNSSHTDISRMPASA